MVGRPSRLTSRTGVGVFFIAPGGSQAPRASPGGAGATTAMTARCNGALRRVRGVPLGVAVVHMFGQVARLAGWTSRSRRSREVVKPHVTRAHARRTTNA